MPSWGESTVRTWTVVNRNKFNRRSIQRVDGKTVLILGREWNRRNGYYEYLVCAG